MGVSKKYLCVIIVAQIIRECANFTTNKTIQNFIILGYLMMIIFVSFLYVYHTSQKHKKK